MANKLKNLRINKVDFVDAGANQRAHIRLFKRAPEGSEKVETNKFFNLLTAIAKKLGIADEDDGSLDTEPKDAVKKSENTNIPTDNNEPQKNEEEMDMRIDKSKMSPGERAFLEEIEKKYSVDGNGAVAQPVVEPTAPEPIVEPNDAVTKNAPKDNIVAQIPELQELLDGIHKRLEQQEDAEMTAVAKKYELLGKKPEDLVPILKRVKKSNTEAYEGLIAVLDQSLDIAKRSNLFGEVGSNANAGSTDSAKRIAKHVSEIRKSRPELSEAEALDMVFQANPDLIAEYDV